MICNSWNCPTEDPHKEHSIQQCFSQLVAARATPNIFSFSSIQFFIDDPRTSPSFIPSKLVPSIFSIFSNDLFNFATSSFVDHNAIVHIFCGIYFRLSMLLIFFFFIMICNCSISFLLQFSLLRNIFNIFKRLTQFCSFTFC